MARIELVEWGGEPAWRCSDCGHWCRGRKKDTRIAHDKYCDLRHTQSVRYPDASAPRAAMFDPLAPNEPNSDQSHLRRLRAAVRRGDLRAHFSDAQIQDAVAAGYISAADAMNQDM